MQKDRNNKTNEKVIHVGLIGFGTVGKGVVRYFLEENGKKFGINLKKVAVSNLKKKRDIAFPHLTDNPQEILTDPEIDVVVELIGGIHPAKEIITSALKNGKSVVSANKALLATHAKELFTLARKNTVDLAYEASVAGGIPIIRILRGLRGEKIDKMMAILNGTTNYILTQMEEGMEFSEALKIAQEKGFAEANHILDTGGFDTRDKLTLLASLIHNTEIKPKDIYCKGITEISPIDIEFAKTYGEKGYAIKLLAIAERVNGSLHLKVEPMLIRKDHPLASVKNEFNAVYIEGRLAGEQMYTGRGAGTNATTSAVISDIIRVAKNIAQNTTDDLPTLDANIKTSKIDNHKMAGYIRMNLKHIPGSLHAVTGILAKHKLNVNDSLQRRAFGQEKKGQTFIPDIVTIEEIEQKVISKALKELGKSNRVDGPPFFLPFEH